MAKSTSFVNELDERDSVAIATYAGRISPFFSKQVVPIKKAFTKRLINFHPEVLPQCPLAWISHIKWLGVLREGAENRVVVLSDGDTNVGRTVGNRYSYKSSPMLIVVSPSTIGLGMGNTKDTRWNNLPTREMATITTSIHSHEQKGFL